MRKILYIFIFSLLSSTAYGSVMDNFSEQDVYVYYASSQKTIKVTLPMEVKGYKLAVYNILGSRVVYTNIPYTNSSLDVSNLKNGQYIVKVTDENGSTVKMLRFILY